MKGSESAHFLAILVVVTRFEASLAQQTGIVGNQRRVLDQPFGVEDIAEETVRESPVVLHSAQRVETKH